MIKVSKAFSKSSELVNLESSFKYVLSQVLRQPGVWMKGFFWALFTIAGGFVHSFICLSCHFRTVVRTRGGHAVPDGFFDSVSWAQKC